MADKSVRFGAAVERIINDDSAGKDFLIDLDTGEFYNAPEDARTSSVVRLRRAIEQGADAFYDNAAKARTLYGLDMLALPAPEWAMNDASAGEVARMIDRLEALGDPGTPMLLSGRGKLPAVYVFKTGKGGRGVLQIIEFLKDERAVKIQYRLLLRRQLGAEEDQ